MKLFMTKEERLAEIERIKTRRAKRLANDEYELEFEKLLKEEKRAEKATTAKPASMNHVYLDLILMLFCFVTVIGAPFGLFFGATAILKYADVRRKRKLQEPRA